MHTIPLVNRLLRLRSQPERLQLLLKLLQITGLSMNY